MNDDIIRMAREAGFPVDEHGYNTKRIERFAALVAVHEKKFWMEQIEVECNEAVLADREACAKVCDDIGDSDNGYGCAAAIRARGEK